MSTLFSSVFVVIGLVLLLFSLVSRFGLGSPKLSVLLLFMSSFFFGLECINDSFLYDWDERYHALVAQNMLSGVFPPRLFPDNALSSRVHSPWWTAYIWMHKGPLFSWQMALSMAVFGKNFIALRLPSLLMVLLTAYSGYRCTKLFYPKAAYLVAIILCFQPFLFLLASGRVGMDHNDVAFTAYISASFWMWVEYINSRQQKWLFGVAIAAAFAILTKWFAGSLIFFIWGLYLLLYERNSVKHWKAIAISVFTCILLWAPWFIYGYLNYPDVMREEYALNGASHLFTVLDQHFTPWYFHLKIWATYLPVTGLLLILGIFVFIKNPNKPAKRISVVSLTAIILIMILFSVAQTRMPAYTIILVVMAVFIAAAPLEWLMNWAEEKKGLQLSLSIILAGLSLFLFYKDFTKHKPAEAYVQNQHALRDFYVDLKDKIPQNSVIFNTPQMQFVDVMFYSERLAYERIPSEEGIREVVSKGYEPIIILDQTFTKEEYHKTDYLKPYRSFQFPH